MNHSLTRRQAIAVAALGATALPGLAQDASNGQEPQQAAAAPKTDRDFVIAAGMTEGEADCWELAAKTAGAFFTLPEMHPMDRGEVASAIHIIQNKLLGRPTYRKYLELAKADRQP